MTDNGAPGVTVELVDTAAQLTIDELSVACNVDPNWIAELVEHGVIEPIGQGRPDWKFASLTMFRIAKASRLERDLNLNLPSLAIVLDLLDEIDDLRLQLRKVKRTEK